MIIFFARFVGELAKRLGQTIMAGEVLTGILLGSVVFGRYFPDLHGYLFPSEGPNAFILQGFSWLCVIFLLLITGLEIDLSAAVRQGRQHFLTSLFAIFIPFAAVFGLTSVYLPDQFLKPGLDPLNLRLMISLSMAVVAIPVIAKVLFDLKILRSFVGLNIITTGVMCDIWGWAILTLIMSIVVTGSVSFQGVVLPLVIILVYFGIALTAGRWITDRFLDWLNLTIEETAGIVAFLFAFALLNGAIAYMLGIHVIFGAFVAGLMAGESKQITPHLRQATQDLISGLFAPIFFVLVGMKLRFTPDMNWLFIAALFAVTSLTKIAGAYLGALIGGLGRKNALAVGCGLNALGPMAIIVALIAKEIGIFNDNVFFAVVLVSIGSDLTIGPLLKWAIKGVKRPLARFFDREHVFLETPGETKKEVIASMSKLMAERKIIENRDFVKRAIQRREESMSTAIGGGVALPHARVQDLRQPTLCFFRLKEPVDFDSPDNVPVQLLFLELTDANDEGMQLNLISQVARLASVETNKKRLISSQNPDEIHLILSMDERL